MMEAVEVDCEVKKFMEDAFKSQINQNCSHHVFSSSQEFCNEENINDCLIYLNQELINHGMNCMFNDLNDFKISSIINSMFGLLQKIHQSIINRDSLEECRHKALSEVEQVQAEKRRLKLKLDASEKELITYKNKVDFLNKELIDKELKIKTDKDEIRSLQALLRSINMQHKNAMKKEEREIKCLKEKIGSLLPEKKGMQPGTKFQENLSKEEGMRGHWQHCSIKKEERFSFWHQENFKFQNDLKQLLRRICTLNTKYFCADDFNLIDNVPPVLGYKPELMNPKKEISGASSTDRLIKNIEEQIVNIQKKLERHHMIGKREALKDRSSSSNFNLIPQLLKKSFVNKAGGDSVIRPRSAIPTQFLNKKRIETKGNTHRGKSFLLGNSQKCHWPKEDNELDMIVPTTNLETCNDEDEGERTTKKPRCLIRSESYTVLESKVLESGYAVDLDRSINLTSQDGSVLLCAPNSREKHSSNGNSTFIHEHTLSIDCDGDDDDDDDVDVASYI